MVIIYLPDDDDPSDEDVFDLMYEDDDTFDEADDDFKY